MKKSVTILTVALLVASSALAIDPNIGDDNIGLFFDAGANVYCTAAAFGQPVQAYVLYVNPSLSSVRGFELGISLVGAVQTNVSIASMPAPYILEGSPTNLIVFFATPIPSYPATVLAILEIFYMDINPVDFILGPSVPSSNTNGNPVVFLDDLSPMEVTAISLPGDVSAQINSPSCLVVADEDVSFGAIKALFR